LPALSLDINASDFLFWCFLKDKVYSSNPWTEEELKENIHWEIANIPSEQFQKVNKTSSAGARNVYV
jgi:hypothetical protein